MQQKIRLQRWFRWNRLSCSRTLAKTTAVESEKRDDLFDKQAGAQALGISMLLSAISPMRPVTTSGRSVSSERARRMIQQLRSRALQQASPHGAPQQVRRCGQKRIQRKKEECLNVHRTLTYDFSLLGPLIFFLVQTTTLTETSLIELEASGTELGRRRQRKTSQPDRGWFQQRPRHLQLFLRWH
jgi:hypothetical protein